MTQAARGHRNMSPHDPSAGGVGAGRSGGDRARPTAPTAWDSVANGGSTYVRERARELGLSMGELADRGGRVPRLHVRRGMGPPELQPPGCRPGWRQSLEAPVRVEAAQPPTVDPQALWDRMEAHGISQNEAARRAGISVGPSLP